jgi:hypothetical protein
MMDPWWNAAAENQAMDRIYRIGQTRDVRAIRFLMKDSIEERMVRLQDAKEALGKGSLQKLRPEERGRAKLTAMKDLFEVEDTVEVWEGKLLIAFFANIVSCYCSDLTFVAEYNRALR